MSKAGRPPAKIDKHQFEQLCALQCTEIEICSYFNVTDKTLQAWCRKTYKMNFSEVFRLKRSKGFISLRRAQFQMAETNPTMSIWLGKQYLGQRDNFEEESKLASDEEFEAMVKALEE